MTRYSKTDAAVAALSSEQYRITQRSGTERPGTGALLHNDEPGIYVDVVSGEPLFSSADKFESGCGWPSFTRPIEQDAVRRRRDWSMLIPRTEVRSVFGNRHLGHVFKDGPQARGGLRFCINSAALRFVHRDDMADQGYGDYLFPSTRGSRAGRMILSMITPFLHASAPFLMNLPEVRS